MKKTIHLLTLCFIMALLWPARINAQPGVNYNDVGVIVNLNDTNSVAIANYFAARRNIPPVNVIPVHTTSDEEINDSMFTDYLLQIRTYLNTHNLADSLNYLVTTKGCPLKILRSNVDCNASAESELMLFTPGNESYIGDCASFTDISNGAFFTNPYFQQTANFSQAAYAIYLVTRLDAYTLAEVKQLIDRSGPNILVNKDSVLFVLDQSPNWTQQPLNANMAVTNSILLNRGWKTKLNSDSVYLTNQSNVIGYFSWGSNDGYSHHYTQNAKPMNTWAPGSIAETGVSTSGRSFTTGTAYGQSLIADLIAEGATGAKGYVYEPFTVAIAGSHTLFNRYTDFLPDGTPKYNLAESYFSASRMIGWMDVVIGDPKTSITTNPDLITAIPPVENKQLSIYPNPANSTLYIPSAGLPAQLVATLTNITGRAVLYQLVNTLNPQLDISGLPQGIYNLRLQGHNWLANSKIAIVR